MRVQKAQDGVGGEGGGRFVRVTHVPACSSLLETSLLHGLVFWRGCFKGQGLWRMCGGGCDRERRAGVKAAAASCLSW